MPLGFADEGAIAALGDVEHRLMHHIIHEPHTARAENAPVLDVEDIPTKVFNGVKPLGFAVPRIRPAFSKGVVLQLTLAGLIADWAVERMIDEQELEHAFPRFERGR